MRNSGLERYAGFKPQATTPSRTSQDTNASPAAQKEQEQTTPARPEGAPPSADNV